MCEHQSIGFFYFVYYMKTDLDLDDEDRNNCRMYTKHIIMHIISQIPSILYWLIKDDETVSRICLFVEINSSQTFCWQAMPC